MRSSISWIGGSQHSTRTTDSRVVPLTHSEPDLRDLHIADALKASGLDHSETGGNAEEGA